MEIWMLMVLPPINLFYLPQIANYLVTTYHPTAILGASIVSWGLLIKLLHVERKRVLEKMLVETLTNYDLRVSWQRLAIFQLPE